MITLKVSKIRVSLTIYKTQFWKNNICQIDTPRLFLVKHKGIIFDVDSSICKNVLDELLKQQVIDKNVHDQKVMRDAVRKLEKSFRKK